MSNYRNRQGRPGSRRGFTLIELLVAMSVIVILAGAVFVTFNYTGGTRGLDKGFGTLHSMARIARAQAILNGTSSRLIIHFDPSEPDKFLRYLGVVVADDSDPECGNCWRAVDRGVYLPDGIFFVPRSKATYGSGFVDPDSDPEAEIQNMKRLSVYKKFQGDSATKDTAVFRLVYPRQVPMPEGGGSEWIGIQFGPNGRLQAMQYGGGGNTPNDNQLVLGRAERGVGPAPHFGDSENLRAMGFKLNGSGFSIMEVDAL